MRLKKDRFVQDSWYNVPHKGTLRHVVDHNAHLSAAASCFDETTTSNSSPQHESPCFAIRIALPLDDNKELEALDDNAQSHELLYTRQDLDFCQRLFAILDTESRGLVGRVKIQEFASLRCPVFWRRDEDLASSSSSGSTTTTFDEIWKAVLDCSAVPVHCRCTTSATTTTTTSSACTYCSELGLEGWMVFCRFIAFAQYLEAKRRFSARHSQQTLRHRKSEVVMVDVPPPEPPAPLSPGHLAQYEQSHAPLPLPELDLDHCLLAAHDTRYAVRAGGRVKLDLFGMPGSSGHQLNVEFAVTVTRPYGDPTVVRRSMTDMKWLDDTISSHKVLGGTLCGRILPPFPQGRKLLPAIGGDDSLLQSTGGAAIAAAAAGVSKIRDAAKQWLFPSTYLGLLADATAAHTTAAAAATANNTAATASRKKSTARKKTSLPESYYNPHLPLGKARQIERYLNYLLEHPALSASFPLNTILTASQSGLEAAKQTLEECNRAAKEYQDGTHHLDDGRLFIPLWTSGSDSSGQLIPNFTWVRTAAQAAMALRIHGMLETTGMPSASARLQHASLPNFGKAKQAGTGWGDDDPSTDDQHSYHHRGKTVPTVADEAGGLGFEDGVIQVQSGLRSEDNMHQEDHDDDGYDLLPLPVPAPERRILTVGSDSVSGPSVSANEAPDTRFHYGSVADLSTISYEVSDSDSRFVMLGNISVDDNIDKLREVIGSVDNTLSRCLGSSGGIGSARRERLKVQLDILRGLDSLQGLRGQFVSQRALLKGVGGLTHSKDIFEESDLMLVDDISWQTSLAHAAVGAAEDVRSAIRASRTAENAKAAANSAAMSAQQACMNGNFATMEEARAAQTRSSIAQSHAIHATVVDHEAKAVKRRATLALANDVKCWNKHRKRELLASCLAYARSQHEGTRRAVDAWSSLRDGFVDTPLIPSSHERRSVAPYRPSTIRNMSMSDHEQDPVATIYDYPGADEGAKAPSIVVSDHSLLNVEPAAELVVPIPPITESSASANLESAHKPAEQEFLDFCDSELILPFATASAIPEEMEGSRVYQAHDGALAKSALSSKGADDCLTESMQSLVDGLMSWGGELDLDVDHMTLPVGMAAGIAMEESGL